jgi:ATP-dependent Zn protease
MKRSREQMRRAAIHEAGHAVIGRVLKQVCGKASIRLSRTENESGHAMIEDVNATLAHWQDDLDRWRGRDSTISVMRGRIMAYMAGRVAEEEFLGRCDGGDGDDQRLIDLMLDSLLPAGADVPKYAQRLRVRVRGLVKRHRSVVERVANLLVEHATLPRRQLDLIVSGGNPVAIRR